MTITFPCNQCGKKYQVESHQADKKIKCKQCGAVVDIPVPRQLDVPPAPVAARQPPRPDPESAWPSLGPREYAMPGAKRQTPAPPQPAEPPQPDTAQTRCPHCGAATRIRLEWRGLTLECPTCRRQFVVPGDRAAPAAAGLPREPDFASDALNGGGPSAHARDDETFGIEAAPATPSPPPIGAYSTSSFELQRGPTGRGRTSSTNIAGWVFGLAAAVVLLVLAWAVLPDDGLRVVMLIGFWMGAALAVIAGFWLLVLAFQESAGCGLMCMFVPGYSLYYLFSRWEETRGSFACNLVGIILMCTSLVIAMSTDGGRSASQSTGPSEPPGPIYQPPVAQTPVGPRQPEKRSFTPEQIVTVNVSGVADSDASYYIVEKLRVLAGPGNPQRSSESGQTLTVTLAPVNDLRAFAAQIDFGKIGKVTVRGQEIDVEVDAAKLPPRRPPPSGTDPISLAVWDLGSPNPARRTDGAKKLAVIPPNQRKAEVQRALEPLVKDVDAGSRRATLKALAVWLGKDALPPLVAMLDDPDGGVCSEAVEALGKLNDERTIEPIAKSLLRDPCRSKAGEILWGMGSAVEPAVLKYIEHGDRSVQTEVCAILKVVGTERSVAGLQAVAKQGDFIVGRRAISALEAIASRNPDLNIEIPDLAVAARRRVVGDETKETVVWRAKPDPAPESIDIAPGLKISIPLPGGRSGDYLFPSTPSPYLAVTGNVNRTDICDVWDVRVPKRVWSLRGKIELEPPLVLSPDGAHLAGKVPFRRGRGIEVFSVRTGKSIGRVEARHDEAFDFAAQNQLIVMGFAAHEFEVWSLTSGRRVQEIKLKHRAETGSLALSAGRRYLALVTTWDEALLIYDLVSGITAGQLELPTVRDLKCKGIMFSRDGAELAGLFELSGDDRILAWDMNTGQVTVDHKFDDSLRATIPGAPRYSGRAIEWLPDRSGWLVYGHGLVSRSTGELVATLPEDADAAGQPRVVASLDHVLTIGGAEKPTVQSFPLPKDKLPAASQ